MDLPTLLVLAVAVVLAVAYFVGGLVNRRRAERWVRALRAAFPASHQPRIAWPSRNSFRLELDEPVQGVRSAVAQVLLAPREALPVWLLWRAQGRGDLLNLQADLEGVPRRTGLIFDPAHRIGRLAWRSAAEALGNEASTPRAASSADGLRVAAGNDEAAGFLEAQLPDLLAAGRVVIFELRPIQPRLRVVLSQTDAPDVAAPRLAAALATLAGSPSR